jgi:Fe-S cluster assembly protein SufD
VIVEAVARETGFVPAFDAEDFARAGEPDWLLARRREALARFRTLGFPTARLEEWRYTNVSPIVETPWAAAPETRGPAVLPGKLPPGVRVLPLSEALESEPELLRAHWGEVAGPHANAFAALNEALAAGTVVVVIDRGAVAGAPIEIRHDAGPSDGPTVLYPRCLVLAGEASQATIVETFQGGGQRFTDAVTEISLADGAVLAHYKVQAESREACHVQTIAARLARSARFESHNVALGGALARTDIGVVLAGEGAECALYGLFVGEESQHLDNFTVIDHTTPHGTSRELYKGILDGRARGVFHGKIIVRPDAQKTDAIQTNKNLLLSKEALVNSTPALEIFADDVKCKHGSTIGQLDAAALFYLRSRGLGEEDARALLTYAFAADVADRVRVPAVRARIEEALRPRLPEGGPEATP